MSFLQLNFHHQASRLNVCPNSRSQPKCTTQPRRRSCHGNLYEINQLVMKYDIQHKRAIQYAAVDAGALWITGFQGYETVSEVILKSLQNGRLKGWPWALGLRLCHVAAMAH
jgi:hypothetical protein